MLFALSVLLIDQSGATNVTTKEKVLLQVKCCTGLQRVVNFLFTDESVRLVVQGAGSWTELYLS